MNTFSRRRQGIERGLERQLRWQNANLALKIALVVVPIALLILSAFYWGPMRSVLDKEGTPVQQGEGEITSIVLPYGAGRREDVRVPSTMVWVRIEGKEAIARTFEPVRTGQRVQAEYRVGRSGRMYVEKVMPLTEKAR